MSEDRSEYADPGGESALYAVTKRNPIAGVCKTCVKRGRAVPSRLSRRDIAKGYQCDICADEDGGGAW